MHEIGYDTRELDEARKKMRSDIAEFNYDSVESLADPESIEEESFSKSLQTLPRSQ